MQISRFSLLNANTMTERDSKYGQYHGTLGHRGTQGSRSSSCNTGIVKKALSVARAWLKAGTGM